MTDVDQAERYDRIAEGYEHWWAPVLAPAVEDLLDRLEPAITAGARRLVDVGTGTGQLALGALQRWPDLEIVGIDPSDGDVRASRPGGGSTPAGRLTGVGSERPSRSPTSCRSTTAPSTGRSPRSSCSSSRTGRARCARPAASFDRAARSPS